MNKLSLVKRAQILGMLVEGNSLRATSRMADVSINTVTKLLIDAGCATTAYQRDALINLPCQRMQVDEIWAFCYAKKKNVEKAKAAPRGAGDVWTWTAICPDTKIAATWLVGERDAEAAHEFLTDLKSRMANRIQLTSDSHRPYAAAVNEAFGKDVDYAQLVKIYGNAEEPRRRYSAGICVGCKRQSIIGRPKKAHISTSIVERQNYNMRMSMRRFTRLSNGFSKKVENHAHAVALHFMYYNFGRIHKTLGVTPAMQAGVTDHVWTMEEIAGLIVDKSPEKRGKYKTRICSVGDSPITG